MPDDGPQMKSRDQLEKERLEALDELAKRDRELLEEIGSRDRAEEALTNVLHVVGKPPDWSNVFDWGDARVWVAEQLAARDREKNEDQTNEAKRMREVVQAVADTGYLDRKTSAEDAIQILDELVDMAKYALSLTPEDIKEMLAVQDGPLSPETQAALLVSNVDHVLDLVDAGHTKQCARRMGQGRGCECGRLPNDEGFDPLSVIGSETARSGKQPIVRTIRARILIKGHIEGLDGSDWYATLQVRRGDSKHEKHVGFVVIDGAPSDIEIRECDPPGTYYTWVTREQSEWLKGKVGR